jgi:hypothetical protein
MSPCRDRVQNQTYHVVILMNPNDLSKNEAFFLSSVILFVAVVMFP